MMWVALTILGLVGWAALLTFVVSACIVAGNADDAADQALHQLTNADRVWRESTAFNAINSGALPPRTGPGARHVPTQAGAGNVLNTQSHTMER